MQSSCRFSFETEIKIKKMIAISTFMFYLLIEFELETNIKQILIHVKLAGSNSCWFCFTKNSRFLGDLRLLLGEFFHSKLQGTVPFFSTNFPVKVFFKSGAWKCSEHTLDLPVI
jgi:hypothetical protein